MAPRNQFIPFPSPFKIKPRSLKYNKQINKQQLNFAPLDRFGQSGGSISNGQKQFFFKFGREGPSLFNNATDR